MDAQKGSCALPYTPAIVTLDAGATDEEPEAAGVELDVVVEDPDDPQAVRARAVETAATPAAVRLKRFIAVLP
jgi:hypothetical protein